MPNHTFTRIGQLILVRQKRTRTNNANNFILYNSSTHNCIKTYNKKIYFWPAWYLNFACKHGVANNLQSYSHFTLREKIIINNIP